MSIYGMDPGDLREEVTRQVQTRTADGGGGAVTTWVDDESLDATFWARIEPSVTAQRVLAFRTDGPISHVVTVRHEVPITEDDMLRWGTRRLKVIGSPVNLDRRREYKTFPCLEEAIGS